MFHKIISPMEDCQVVDLLIIDPVSYVEHDLDRRDSVCVNDQFTVSKQEVNISGVVIEC